MSNGPAAYYLDALRKLDGSPQITYPQDDLDCPKLERVITVPKGKALPAYGSPDPKADYAALGARLTVCQVLGTDKTQNHVSVYTVHEVLGTRAQQDLWNEHPRTYPYGSLAYPRVVRRYRFFTDSIPALYIGQSTDTEVVAAKLVDLSQEDENAAVTILTATFDDVPAANDQAGLGGTGGLGVSISYPYATKDYPLVTWKYRVALGDYAPASDYAACPIPGYTALELVDQGRTPSDDVPGMVVASRVYQRLPGPLITTQDAARIPRQLTPIPAYYLNGDVLTTTVQDLAASDATTGQTSNTLLSSKVDAKNLLVFTRTNVSRPDDPLPTILLPQIVRDADNALGVESRSIVVPNATVPRGFGYWSGSMEPLSPTQSELRSLHIAAFPIRAGSDNGRPGTVYPGKYSFEDGGSEETWEQIVPTGASIIGLPANYGLLKRVGLDAYHDRVTYGIQRPSGGTTFLSGVELTERGDLATWTNNLGGGITTGNYLVLKSAESPAGAGKVENYTLIANQFATLTSREIRGANIPEEFLAGVPLVITDDKVIASASLPGVGPTVFSCELKADNQYRSSKIQRSLPDGLSIDSLYQPKDSEFGRDAAGEQVKVERKVVNTGDSVPDTSFKTLEYERKDIGNGLAVQTIRTLDAGAFPTLVDFQIYDKDLGVRMKVERQVVDASTVPTKPPDPADGVCVVYEATEDKRRSVKVTRTLLIPATLPKDVGEVAAMRPTLLKGIDNVGTRTDNGEAKYYWNKTFGGPYRARTETTYEIGSQLTADPIEGPPRGDEFHYDGQFINVHETNLLVDGGIYIKDGPDQIDIKPVNGTASGYPGTSTPVIASTVHTYGFGLVIKATVKMTPK